MSEGGESIVSKFKPMKGEEADPDKLIFPLIASRKYDGIRCLSKDGTALSYSLKKIQNKYIREHVEKHSDILNGYDGELLLSDLTAPFNTVSSAIMSREGEPDFRYVIFDNWMYSDLNYKDRFLARPKPQFPDFVIVIESFLIKTREQLDRFEKHCVDEGYEGVIVRRADGKDIYKFGRSTQREHFLLKIKQFVDDEGVIVGFEERMHNGNEATTDAHGNTKRSTHKANKVGRGDLGALIVKCKNFEGEFNIGTGFSDELRTHIWDNRETHLGKIVKFKYQKVGTKDAPRILSFIGFRHEDDM